jgi:hypothetical protein
LGASYYGVISDATVGPRFKNSFHELVLHLQSIFGGDKYNPALDPRRVPFWLKTDVPVEYHADCALFETAFGHTTALKAAGASTTFLPIRGDHFDVSTASGVFIDAFGKSMTDRMGRGEAVWTSHDVDAMKLDETIKWFEAQPNVKARALGPAFAYALFKVAHLTPDVMYVVMKDHLMPIVNDLLVNRQAVTFNPLAWSRMAEVRAYAIAIGEAANFFEAIQTAAGAVVATILTPADANTGVFYRTPESGYVESAEWTTAAVAARRAHPDPYAHVAAPEYRDLPDAMVHFYKSGQEGEELEGMLRFYDDEPSYDHDHEQYPFKQRPWKVHRAWVSKANLGLLGTNMTSRRKRRRTRHCVRAALPSSWRPSASRCLAPCATRMCTSPSTFC